MEQKPTLMMMISNKTASINNFEGKRQNIFGTTDILFNPLDSNRKNETAGGGNPNIHRNLSKQFHNHNPPLQA